MTDSFRSIIRWLFAGTIMLAWIGWAFEMDIGSLNTVIGWLVAAGVVGEGANIGKRVTYRSDHHENGAE